MSIPSIRELCDLPWLLPILLPSLAMCGPEGGIPSDERDLGAGVTAMTPCSEKCGVSTRLSSLSTTPPAWVPLDLALCLVRDDPAARRPKIQSPWGGAQEGLGGLCVQGSPAL